MTRNVLQNKKIGPMYTCLFAVKNYSEWVGSCVVQDSEVFYIDQAKTYVKATAEFTKDKKMAVNLVYRNCPSVAMEQSQAASDVRFNVKIVVVNCSGGGNWMMRLARKF